jgi:hypothetical protein
MKTPDTIDSTPPWTRIFIEIALRGLLRLHLDYLLWSLPQTWRTELDSGLLTSGPGVAFADEPTVCAAISQEFMVSRSVSGGWIDAPSEGRIEAGRRFFRLSREVQYPSSRERTDLCVERIDPNSESVIGRPAFIEAKRAFRWSTKLGASTASATVPLLTEISADIEKLRRTCHGNSSLDKAPRGYVLVWNITDQNRGTEVSPIEYLERLGDSSLVLWQVRSAPLASPRKAPAEFSLMDATVNRWLWVAMMEVTPVEPHGLHLGA